VTRSAEEIGRLLGTPGPTYSRIILFGALLSTEIGSEVIVVGGSAIEVYTRGGYASGDIDIVGGEERIRTVLKRWGFHKDGRIWIQEDWKLAVDTVGEHYTGDRSRTRELSTSYGRVRLAGVEDLIAKRLASAKHWNIPDDIGQAAQLLAGFGDEIDWTYLQEVAARHAVTDLLIDLRKRVERAGHVGV
jgi:hypothetical protein